MCEARDSKPGQEMVLKPSPLSASLHSSAEAYSEHTRLFYSLPGTHEGAISNTSHTGIAEGRNHVREDTSSGSVRVISKTCGTKPKHVCKECGKIFKRAHNLKIHGRLHSGVRPYQCPFEGCGKDFRWKSSIVSHINWHRSKMGEELPENVSVHKLKKNEIEGLEGRVEERGGIGVSEIVNSGFEMVEGFDAGEEKDDCTVVTQGCASYQASPAAMGVAELDCYNVLDVKEWEARQDGGRMGAGLMPSLSCCRMENEGSFGTFLD